MTTYSLRYLLILLVLSPLALAQFGGFFQGGFPFGQNPFHQQDDGSQTPHREHKGWTEMEHTGCGAGYLCPGSLACVPTPADCPCPYPEDVKCVIPDNRPRDEGEGPPFVCVRGKESCEEVNRHSKRI